MLGRLLVILLSVQLSGVAHEAAELAVSILAGHAEHEDECAPDRPCSDCPAGCANCHCSPLRSLLPHQVTHLRAGFAAGDVTYSGESGSPPGPDLPSIFRPPRAA
jgi:hypothetical protein